MCIYLTIYLTILCSFFFVLIVVFFCLSLNSRAVVFSVSALSFKTYITLQNGVVQRIQAKRFCLKMAASGLNPRQEHKSPVISWNKLYN